jgi:hypothetical protein
MPERKMCTYCGKWHDFSVMTPLFEQGKTYIEYYCEGCWETVRDNVFNLPYSHLFSWGVTGSHNEE